MPTDPAEVTIYNEVEARANNIQESNGYHSSVQEIERSRLTPFTEGDWPKFSFWPIAAPQNDDQYGFEQHTLTIIIGYFDQTRDEPFADLAAKMKADVVAAMHRSTAAPAISDTPSFDLGGLVESFTVTNSDFVINEGQAPWCGVLVEVEIKYKSESGNPFAIST
jgi:hypothetical protein